MIEMTDFIGLFSFDFTETLQHLQLLLILPLQCNVQRLSPTGR